MNWEILTASENSSTSIQQSFIKNVLILVDLRFDNGHIASSNDWNQPFKHYIELFSIVATCTGGQYYIYTTYKSSFGMQIISFCSEKLFYIFSLLDYFLKYIYDFFFKYLTGFLGKEKQSCIFLKKWIDTIESFSTGNDTENCF